MGQPTPRVYGAAKLSGQARYATDVRLSGITYAEVLRSPPSAESEPSPKKIAGAAPALGSG